MEKKVKRARKKKEVPTSSTRSAYRPPEVTTLQGQWMDYVTNLTYTYKSSTAPGGKIQ